MYKKKKKKNCWFRVGYIFYLNSAVEHHNLTSGHQVYHGAWYKHKFTLMQIHLQNRQCWRKEKSNTMGGFITTGKLNNYAQSGSIWSRPLSPQWSKPQSVDLTKLVWVSLGHFRCVLGSLGISLISTQWNRPRSHQLPALPEGRLYWKQPAAEIAIALPSNIPLSLHTQTHTHF